MVHLTIEDAASILSIGLVLWGVLKFGLTGPLETAIKELRQTINQMNTDNKERDRGIREILDKLSKHDMKLTSHETRLKILEEEHKHEND
ncbi:hypothetical protein [Limosilactobacillus albertensis]|uniref:Uncharacterized protein n=1 Tax=Limosilactobacillus albertensis TaxID=2759752 RepID=A0A839H9M0_9LACO|nr:hypothetical protein [Limosilactobacillus albertensis]MBB1123289.1 hypothetical protein [Limosilactobacillus albertensis]MCD7121299.1 hypothetical protein [Limosilactobacillus albertensis]